MSFEIVVPYIGKMGAYQKCTLVAFGLVNAWLCLQSLLVNFLSPHHDSWCLVPELANMTSVDQLKLATPFDEETGSYDTCSMYNVSYDVVYEDGWNMSDTSWQQNTTKQKCEYGYVFDDAVFTATASSEWDLVCGDSWMHEMISPMFMIGMLLGSYLSGITSDGFGRKLGFMIFTIVHILSGLATSFAPNVWVYSLGRALIGVAVRGAGLCAIVMLMEITGPAHRSVTAVLFQIFYSLGGVIAAFVGYCVRHFRLLQLVMTIPQIFMLSYWWFVVESPRWLLARGRYEEAVKGIEVIAKWNRVDIPEKILDQIRNNGSEGDINPAQADAKSDSEHSLPIVELVRHPSIRKYTIICSFSLVASFMTFHGVSMNIDQLFGDVYLNLAIASFTDIPCYLALMFGLEKFGRVHLCAFCYLFSTLCQLIAIPCLLIDGLELGSTLLSLLAKSVIACGSSTIVIYIGEVFPTNLRNRALGVAYAVSAGIGIFAPVVGGTFRSIWKPLPNIIFSSLATVAGILVLVFLPETKGRPLPDTIQDSVALDRPSTTRKAAQSTASTIELCDAEVNERDVIQEPCMTPRNRRIVLMSSDSISISSHEYRTYTAYTHQEDSVTKI